MANNEMISKNNRSIYVSAYCEPGKSNRSNLTQYILLEQRSIEHGSVLTVLSLNKPKPNRRQQKNNEIRKKRITKINSD